MIRRAMITRILRGYLLLIYLQQYSTTTGRLQADYLRLAGRLPADYRPTTGRPSAA